MITELRRIVFDNVSLQDALQNAIRTWGVRPDNKWPRGKLERMEISVAPNISVSMRVFDHADDTRNTVTVGPPEIGAALILYCTQQKIPLPRDADKSLGVSGDNLSLIVEKHLDRNAIAGNA